MHRTIYFLIILTLTTKGAISGSSTNKLKLLQVENNTENTNEMNQLKLRRSFLKWHNYTAWGTVGLIVGSMITIPENGEDDTQHKFMGILSGITYLTSASLAYFAPRPKGIPQNINIMIHEKLTWIHAPAMILTMISGIKAHKTRERGEDLGGFEKFHKLFGAIAVVSFGLAAITSMDWSINFIPFSINNKKEVACFFTKKI